MNYNYEILNLFISVFFWCKLNFSHVQYESGNMISVSKIGKEYA